MPPIESPTPVPNRTACMMASFYDGTWCVVEAGRNEIKMPKARNVPNAATCDVADVFALTSSYGSRSRSLENTAIHTLPRNEKAMT